MAHDTASRAHVTVKDWIASRTSAAPPALTVRMLGLLGVDADASASRAAELCLAAAARALEKLLADGRFGREDAIELLAIDALTTLGFEHASQGAGSDAHMSQLARQGARALGQLAAQRV